MSKSYRGGIPNPEVLGFIPLRFVGSDGSAAAKDIAELARILDQPPTFVDDEGYDIEIIAAAIGGKGSKLAWVESRFKEKGDFEDITFTLHAWVGNRQIVEWEVESYNPYFGCDVQYLAWWGNQVVVIYREKHHNILATLSASGPPLLRGIGDYWEIIDDHVYFREEYPGLLEVVRIPSLEARMPLPDPLYGSKGTSADPLKEFTDVAPFMMAVREAMFGKDSPQPETDLLIGSLLFPFWTPLPEIGYDYSSVYNSQRYHSMPIWLPLYWHLHLGGGSSTAVILLLNQALGAALPSSPELMRRASILLKDRSALLLEACLAGRLPDKERDLSWMDWPIKVLEYYIDLFPRGFAECFCTLKQDKKRWQRLTGVRIKD